ncbi:hypothetical protein ACFVDQ_16345 [Streptomyces sp. NPDC057684]|uniref:hypothetical protein n=1 Tax=Streptomyces sp. NPDC057684 TaxID=3346211 RepID=UPI0036BD41C9
MARSNGPEGPQDEERGSERPDYLVEDEATWQPNDNNNVPPVIDNSPKNSER